MKLNKSKPFGRIAGTYAAFPDARFTQGAFFFNANGDCLNETTKRQDDDGQKHDAKQANENEARIDEQPGNDGQGHDGQLDGHDQADVQTQDHESEREEEQQDGSDGLLEDELELPEELKELEDTGPVMSLSDDELVELADDGMAELRKYSSQFGVNGTKKQDIIDQLKELRK